MAKSPEISPPEEGLKEQTSIPIRARVFNPRQKVTDLLSTPVARAAEGIVVVTTASVGIAKISEALGVDSSLWFQLASSLFFHPFR